MWKVQNYFLGFYLVGSRFLHVHVEKESDLKLLSKLHLRHANGEDWLFLMRARHPVATLVWNKLQLMDGWTWILLIPIPHPPGSDRITGGWGVGGDHSRSFLFCLDTFQMEMCFDRPKEKKSNLTRRYLTTCVRIQRASVHLVIS